MSQDLLKIGGKAKGLLKLQSYGVDVPPFIILDTSLFELFIRDIRPQLHAQLARLVAAPDALIPLAEQIRQIICEHTFSVQWEELFQQLLMTSPQLNLHDGHFSIRSSAVDEDGLKHSFAGQMDSFLYVKGPESIRQSIRRCYASAFSERVLSYRLQNQLEILNISMAVIVQKMVFGSVSGVLFTANPLNNNPEEMLLSATWGIGEGVVSGELDCDQWVLGENGDILRSEVVEKREMITFNQSTQQGSTHGPVANDQMAVPCLKPEEIQELYMLGDLIEQQEGFLPQDIEWTIEAGKIYLLQTRPITTLAGINRLSNKTIWDNSNIVESYSGVTSPLTFSFASRAYEQVYRQFYNMIGTPISKINRMDSVFGTLLGHIDGRIYYNLSNWYKTLRLLPGYDLNREFMEAMMGVKAKGNANLDLPQAPTIMARMAGALELIRGVSTILYKFFTIDRDIHSFFENFNRTAELVHRRPLAELSSEELLALYREMDRKLLGNWKTPIMNDFFTMIFYGLLKKRIVTEKIDDGGSLQNDLLCGQGDVESTKPTRLLIEIANWIASAPDQLASFVQSTSEEDLLKLLSDEQLVGARKELRDQILRYIDLYGFRCVNELKLEEDSLKENPIFIFSMLKNYLRKGKIDLQAMELKERQKRLEAEERVKQSLSKKPILFFFGREKLFFWLVEQARRMVKNRENLRFTRTKVFGFTRQIFNAHGANFVRAGLLDHPKDIYFLTVEEIHACVEGRSVTQDLRALIQLRKKENEQFRASEEPAERFYTYRAFFESPRVAPTLVDPGAKLDLGPGVLKGTACSPGKIRQKARVVLTPQEGCLLNGEILVTARTDPGWVPVFPSISGLLIERGSILSHSAVVAREMGIPTIVGLTKITQKMQDGQEVAFDGGKGICYLDLSQLPEEF